ncbi:hypothetical protein BCR34DRAFT_604961 [Clohesyomyces aquaticus]|uniref:Uncharacterized protein n=1 Tax=Clohesyomyces aquaticus TaxID=1231657 RepID=A0A1Y1Z1F4_9PLEO|nr:hypothetical protein BCR34DRAFT_604961 [Clohesyomyces aquaticus]
MASPTRNAFARALETYISDIKRDEDPSSPFYTEVLSILSTTQSPPMASQVKRSEEQLIQLIQDLDSRQRRSSKIRRISDKLHPFVTGLSRYTNCCDVLIQAAPSAAVLLYGGARIVLQLAEKFHNCFETVLSIMEDVGKLLDCYNLFAKAYEASADMQQLLVETYKNIVSFWQKATKLFSRKAYKTLLRGIVKPLDAEWQKCRQALEDDSKHVARFAQATEADLARQRDEERALHQQAKLRRQIVDWIKGRDDDVKLDTRPDLRQNLETRYQDTCEWFFEQPGVEAWLVAKKSTAIWYSAGPGTGKTITASGLAHRLQDEGRRTATFFCSFNDVVRRKTITVFRSIALQLLSTSDSIPERVKRLYEEDLTHHCSNLTDIRVALEVVEHLIKQLPRIHIIVDGLDECADRRELLAAICHLLHAKTYGIVKWFFSSRGDSDIRNALRRHEVIEIEARQDCLMSDIRKYLTPRLHCDECVDHWTSLSDGNFLWMSHMLPVIEGETSTCAEDLEEELKTFPKGLTGCYARSLAHLSKRPEKHQQLARRIFTMVVGAVQPLRLRELTHALAASKGTSDYSERSLPRMELIEELCSNLIKFDRGTNGTDDDPVLKVIHKSVQDFFLQNPESLDLPDASLRQYFVTSEAANLELGQSALSYLSYVRYNRPQDVSALMKNKEHAFLQHAAIFWYRYLDDATSSRSLSAKVVDFVRSEAFWTCVAVQAQIAPHLFALYTNTGCGFTIQATGPQKDKELDKVAYAIPLPDWLESGEYGTEGPQIMETFHKFVMEWHPVLNSHRSAVNECAMDFEWLMNMPGRITWQSSRVKFFTVPGTHSSSKALPISIIDLAIESEEVLIRTLERHDIPARYTFGTIQFPDTSVISLEGIKVESAYSVTAPVSADLYAFSVSDDLQKKFWLVDISSVKARQITADSEEINVQELLLQNPPPGRHTTRRWSLNCRATRIDTPPIESLRQVRNPAMDQWPAPTTGVTLDLTLK